jgi:hypothetical protein
MARLLQSLMLVSLSRKSPLSNSLLVGWLLLNALYSAEDTPKVLADDAVATSWRRSIDEGPGDREDRLLRTMFAYGLHDSAVRYVRERSSLATELDAVAWWTMREMECLAQRGLSNPTGSADGWVECQNVVERFRSQHVPGGDTNQSARWPWLVWQLGRCQLLQLQKSLALVLANPANADRREAALELARSILQDMSRLQDEIQRRQPLAARQPADGGTEAPAEQLRNLDADVQLLMAETLLVRAHLYPQGSPDRIAALAELLRLVRDVLQRVGQDWPLRPAMQLAEATAQLEMGEPAATEKLEQLVEGSGSNRVRVLAAISLAKTLAQNEKSQAASELMVSIRPLVESDKALAPHWALAQLELRLWEVEAGDAQMQEAAIQSLAAESREFAERFGDYWRTRAESLIVGRLSSEAVSDAHLAMDLLMAEVRQLVAGNQISLAVQKLLQARDVQSNRRSGELALQLAASAAALLRQGRQWEESIAALEPIAVDFSQVRGADESHIWVIRANAEILKSDANAPTASQQYEASLMRHLELWPDSKSSDQVAQWLEDWLVSSNRRDRWISVLLRRLQKETRSEAADAHLQDLCEQLILSGSDHVTSMLEQAGGQQAEGQQAEEKWDRTGFALASVATAAQQVLLAVQSLVASDGLANWGDRTRIEQRLQRFQQWLNDRDSQLFEVKKLVAVAALIDQIRLNQQGVDPSTVPVDQSTSIDQTSPYARRAVAVALVEALDACEESRRKEIWRKLDLQSDWSKGVWSQAADTTGRSPPLSPISQISLARLDSMLGQASSLEKIQQLAQKHSRNGAVQLSGAYHWCQLGESDRAIQAAKRIVAFSEPGSPLQLSARWCLLRCQLRAGLVDQARKAARLTLVTYAEMEPIWRLRFENLSSL